MGEDVEEGCDVPILRHHSCILLVELKNIMKTLNQDSCICTDI
jgi:hypothetical protein